MGSGNLYAPSGGFASTDTEDDVLAETDPSTSTLRICVPPLRGESIDADLPMLKLVAFGFREELLHGERQQFGLARNGRLLKLQSWQALHRCLEGELTVSEAADTIYFCQRAAEDARDNRRMFLETVDQFRVQSVVDQEYLRDYAQGYADRFDRSAEDLMQEFETEQQGLHKQIRDDLLYEEVYQPLMRVAENYEQRVAEAVAHAALDLPVVLQPLDDFFTIDTEPFAPDDISSELFVERLEGALDTLEQLDQRRDPNEMDQETLGRELRQDLPPEGYGSEPPRPLQDLPLLDHPHETLGDPTTTQRGYRDMSNTSSRIDEILNGAFRVVANLGGAVYQLEVDDRASLVNPWIADETVDGRRYRDLWQREFFGDHVVRTLWKQMKGDVAFERETLECPMCAVSRDGDCGSSTCTSSEYMGRIRDRMVPLVNQLRQLDDKFDENGAAW